jgi:hypothetical protein
VLDEDAKRKELHRTAFLQEENHYNAIKRVFGTDDGTVVLEWLLTDLCGYWRGSLANERELGRFELGRTVFNQVCMADIEIAHNILDRRRKAAETVRNKERKRFEKGSE